MPRAGALLVVPEFVQNQPPTSTRKPTTRETLCALLEAIDFVHRPRHRLVAAFFFFHLATGLIFVCHLLWFLTPASVVFISLATFFLGTIYNTVWYHRYCSHKSFRFHNHWQNALFRWTNPLLFKEENYAIPHNVHHQITDRRGDPYGPHLGWLASFFSSEITQRINADITELEFNLLRRRVHHIGFVENSYHTFRQTGSIERTRSYIARTVAAQLLWAGSVFAAGGVAFLTAWYSAIFLILVLIRDFNWRGHGGNKHRPKKRGWEFDNKSYALNQYFYGYLASEWHDNHHRYPMSANNAFRSRQVDVAFQVIRLLKAIGIVKSYVNTRLTFERQCIIDELPRRA